MKGKKKRELRKRIRQNDRKINKRNKNLMVDKILSYNPVLVQGIELYKDSNRNFILLILLGALLIDFPLISVPCCILSMFFLIKMLKFIRYKSINSIVRELAKDLSVKGIYDKEKVEDMLDDFKVKYGDDVIEYVQLVEMLEKYEALVTKIEYVLKNINISEEKDFYTDENIIVAEENNEIQYKNRDLSEYYKDFSEKLSVIYKKEDGEVRKVNKAIEFFDNEDNESYDNSAIMLKNINKDNKKLTVYLYKKSATL